MIRAFIFDLDGTLVDTIADIAAGMNTFLRAKGWPEHDVPSYKRMVGRGLINLIRAAVPASEAGRAEELYPEAYAAYDDMGIGSSTPYPGATEALRILSAGNAPLAVISNKPDDITRKMVAGLFPDIPFAMVRGGLPGVPAKPDPFSALEAAGLFGLPPSDCAFVGDSDVDMKTALAAGMRGIGAAWGFRGEAELRSAGAVTIARSMADIAELLGSP